ncbi:hypothetical protein AZE42_10681 [Rhizopogon vesiculosus]|uniref:Uncharacterized protein n=1 Tax=Rhizopogon vesiculosus TaxID=180088 RepID=A0A1J8QFY6_9AGAM|nr:hypothetical protein AZE42_10681 [Rhizopogon vesiculosus]
MVPFQVYINSYIALLNARYYLQPNSDVIDSPKPYIPHNAHNQELPTRPMQADSMQASRKSLFEHEVVHLTRPVSRKSLLSRLVVAPLLPRGGLNDTL